MPFCTAIVVWRGCKETTEKQVVVLSSQGNIVLLWDHVDESVLACSVDFSLCGLEMEALWMEHVLIRSWLSLIQLINGNIFFPFGYIWNEIYNQNRKWHKTIKKIVSCISQFRNAKQPVILQRNQSSWDEKLVGIYQLRFWVSCCLSWLTVPPTHCNGKCSDISNFWNST